MNDNLYTLEQRSRQIQGDWLAGAEQLRQARLARVSRTLRRAAKVALPKRPPV
ncbi:MAG: hypothetical protein M3Z04_14555 [Chloroflexota bacterium]|nr:hypothetical protein [Chloroflexota bacterium]